MIEHLRVELGKLESCPGAWQGAEVRTNVCLLVCALTDTVDDYLLGTQYDFSQVGAVVPGLGRGVRAVEALWRTARVMRRRRLAPIRRWRDAWKTGVNAYLRAFAAAEQRESRGLVEARDQLLSLLQAPVPDDLLERRARIPAAFRTQDLTHGDIFMLARTLAQAYPDRERPIVIVGLRTAGSYFAPLIGAWLTNAGYRDADWITIRPTRVMGPAEHAALADVASRGGMAVVVDEAPNTGSTLAKAVGLVRTAGFVQDHVALLVPIHPTRPDWATGPEAPALSGTRTLTLPPAAWQKHQWLETQTVQQRLTEYFHARGYATLSVTASSVFSRAFNRQLRTQSDEKFHTRLKRVYEVHLRDQTGRLETRYVIAKSVGWGWLGYHAFLAADRLRPLCRRSSGCAMASSTPSGCRRCRRPADRSAAGDRDAGVVHRRARRPSPAG